jgi:predicted acylesterase/phospholipase RssA
MASREALGLTTVVGEEAARLCQPNVTRAAAVPEQPGHIGLALSGGGIRSATFCLGVLQALSQRQRLASFDYLSTVSGGGYIGSWLSAWIKRAGLHAVQCALGGHAAPPPHRPP